jgi:hypothetical protein
VWDSPSTFGQSVFLLLLVTKLPVLGALYQVLTTVSASQKVIQIMANRKENHNEFE